MIAVVFCVSVSTRRQSCRHGMCFFADGHLAKTGSASRQAAMHFPFRLIRLFYDFCGSDAAEMRNLYLYVFCAMR